MKFAYLLATILFVQCTLKQNEDSNFTAEAVSFLNTEKLNISVPKEAFNSYMHLQVYQDSLLYGINPASPYSIAVFNLKLQRFERNISLEPHLFKEKPGAFYVHQPDSIFITGTNYPTVQIISGRGSIINKFNLRDLGLNKECVLPALFHYTSPYYDPIQKQLFLTTLPLDWDQLGVHSESFTQAVFDLSTEKMIAEFAPIQGTNRGVLPYDLNIPYRLVEGETIYISYPTKEVIELYDRKTFVKISEKRPISDNDIVPIEPLSANKAQDEQELWNYRITVPFYEPIFYHADSRCFSRIWHHPQELKPDGRTLNDGSQREATMFIFDNNLNLLKKQKFTNGLYGVRRAVPLSEGVMFAAHEKHWTSEDTLSLRYKINF